MTTITRTFTLNDNSQAKVAINSDDLAVAEALKAIGNRFTVLKGYVSTSKRLTPEVADHTVNANASVESLYKRRMAALANLETLSLEMLNLEHWVPSKGKNAKATAEEQFEFCKAAMIASMQKTIDGDRNDAHRKGHDRCFVPFSKGVRLHLVTEKVAGIMQPVKDSQGRLQVESVQLKALPHSKRVVTAGTYKPVNSGSKVLMDNAIKKAWNAPSLNFSTYKLASGNFDKVVSGDIAIED